MARMLLLMSAMHPEQPDMPTRVGRYRLLRSLSRGGMAEVFEASLEADGGFARRYAIKMPHRDTALQELAAFADEARILSQLQHPCIVGVFDFGTHEGWPYQVLEFIDGVDLIRLSRLQTSDHPLTPALALMIAGQAARALHYAHGAMNWMGEPLGIIHRDVSPQNILVSWRGEVKLIDFGIAKAEGRLTKTQDGIVKGKLSFMAPEQFGGQRLTPVTDVFGLGCVLYFMLLGDSPFPSEQAWARAAQGLRPKGLDTLDADLASIIEKAVALKPSQRHESALAFGRDCSRALSRRVDSTSMALHNFMTTLRTLTREVVAIRPKSTRPKVPQTPSVAARKTSGTVDIIAPTVAVTTSQLGAREMTSTVAGFNLIKPLDMGKDIHEATPTGDGSKVTVGLRVMECDGLPAGTMARRLADAAAMSTLHHDNLVRVREFGVDQEVLYIAFDRPRGRTLKTFIEDVEAHGGLTSQEISAVALGMLSAVRFARQSLRRMSGAYLARDIRPETFFLSHDGFPQLMDTLIAGPLIDTGDPYAVETESLLRVVESLPRLDSADHALDEAIDDLRRVRNAPTLSNVLLAFRRSTQRDDLQSPHECLAERMRSLYEAPSDARTSERKAMYVGEETVVRPQRAISTARIMPVALELTQEFVTEIDQ